MLGFIFTELPVGAVFMILGAQPLEESFVKFTCLFEALHKNGNVKADKPR